MLTLANLTLFLFILVYAQYIAGPYFNINYIFALFLGAQFLIKKPLPLLVLPGVLFLLLDLPYALELSVLCFACSLTPRAPSTEHKALKSFRGFACGYLFHWFLEQVQYTDLNPSLLIPSILFISYLVRTQCSSVLVLNCHNEQKSLLRLTFQDFKNARRRIISSRTR